MTRTECATHREKLLMLYARLHGDMTGLADAALNGELSKINSLPTHIADLGSDYYEQELTLSLLGNEKEVLDQIEAALRRIAEGAYGLCEDCGKEIPAARLEAIPYAATCVRCASRRERRHAA